jgi:nucleoside-diphosphate-sugar epimerase
MDVADNAGVAKLFADEGFDRVIHLAAQAGVRYSLQNPHAYVDSNLEGFINILEGCRHGKVQHLTYASSSSVYGGNTKMPFSEHDSVDHPVSLYAATKKANELMAHTYSHLYGLPTTGLRFFTVYGPWGRPDMALFLFTKAILEGRPIDVFNYGNMQRDFTYVDDIVEGVIRVNDRPATPNPAYDAVAADPATSSAPYRVFNIGNNNPVPLLDFIGCIEDALGKQGREAPAAAAGRRRAGHLCQHRCAAGLGGLRARHQRQGRHRALCGLVPGVLPGLTRRSGRSFLTRDRADVVQQAAHTGLAQVQHPLEALQGAVVRVGYLQRAGGWRKFHQQAQLVCVLARARTSRNPCRSPGGRAPCPPGNPAASVPCGPAGPSGPRRPRHGCRRNPPAR